MMKGIRYQINQNEWGQVVLKKWKEENIFGWWWCPVYPSYNKSNKNPAYKNFYIYVWIKLMIVIIKEKKWSLKRFSILLCYFSSFMLKNTNKNSFWPFLVMIKRIKREISWMISLYFRNIYAKVVPVGLRTKKNEDKYF